MTTFWERRAAEIELLSFLTRTETDTLCPEKGAIHIEPIPLEPETEDDRCALIGKLHQRRNCLAPELETLYSSGVSFTTRIDFKSLYGYQNVLAYDEQFARGIPGYTIRRIEADGSGGWVWLFWNETTPFLGMIGIRASVVRFLTGARGTASQILQRVLEFAATTGKTRIVVPNPLWGMRGILTKHGFERTEQVEETEETRFIAPVEPTRTYYCRRI